MKKSFKTIMATVAALAISMSGMSMTSADEDPTPQTTQSVTINGNPATGKFDAIDPIPVTMGTEHLLSFTIDFGDMAMSYDSTDTSEANNYGWGDSFDGENNKLTITNNSTCKVLFGASLNIDTANYPCLDTPGFRFTNTNDNGAFIERYNYFEYGLSYASNQTEGAMTSYDLYLTVDNENFADMHNYNFINAKIGEITITLKQLSGYEQGYYIKLTSIGNENQTTDDIYYTGDYTYEEARAIVETVNNGTPYYLGPYNKDDAGKLCHELFGTGSTYLTIYIS